MNTIIFGATGGIGSALTRKMANGNNRLLICGRDDIKLKLLAEETKSSWNICETTQSREVDQVFMNAQEIFEKIDSVVFCVGSLILKPAHMTSDEEFKSTIDTNLSGAFYVLRAAVKAMMREGGSIVFVSSAAARTGIANHEAIAAAKAGLIGLGLSAAATYAPRGIRINVVAPGLVETPLTETLLKSDVARTMSEGMHALKRIGKPEDVSTMIAWLISEEASWITGQIFGVDGGLATLKPRLESVSR